MKFVFSPKNKTRRVNITFSHTTTASESGGSFLDLLCNRFPYHDREQWTQRILAGQVLLNGSTARPDSALRLGMQVKYRVEDYEEPMVPIDFKEIISTDELALVHKPAGMPVHKTGKIFVHTLANLYRQDRVDQNWSPLNRLDVETSGIVAFAKGSQALKRFSPVEPGTRWKKIYLAVVHGELKTAGTIEFPLAEKKGDAIRSRMHADPNGKPAKTLYHPLMIHENKTLVLIRTFTGRKHQIRAHLASLGFPIVGDKTYSLDGHYYLKRLESELSEEDFRMLGAPHHLLHAFHLEIHAEEDVNSNNVKSDIMGIQGTDFDLPESFFEMFPELSNQLTSITSSKDFLRMNGDEYSRLDASKN